MKSLVKIRIWKNCPLKPQKVEVTSKKRQSTQITNLERAKGKAGGKKYAPSLKQIENGWQKVHTNAQKDTQKKEKKKEIV